MAHDSSIAKSLQPRPADLPGFEIHATTGKRPGSRLPTTDRCADSLGEAVAKRGRTRWIDPSEVVASCS